jgi:hypothetical protein
LHDDKKKKEKQLRASEDPSGFGRAAFNRSAGDQGAGLPDFC